MYAEMNLIIELKKYPQKLNLKLHEFKRSFHILALTLRDKENSINFSKNNVFKE